jgi:hypothetical protein
MSIRKTATRHPQLRSRLGSPAAARRAVIGSELKPVLRDDDKVFIKIFAVLRDGDDEAAHILAVVCRGFCFACMIFIRAIFNRCSAKA